MRLIPMRVRRRLKRRRHARQWRRLEYVAFLAHPVIWCRLRALNNVARVWARHPEHPRKDNR